MNDNVRQAEQATGTRNHRVRKLNDRRAARVRPYIRVVMGEAA
ncbi:hypothetical protein NOGI109294_16985 [Nocardiopsis gilva]